MADNSFAHVLSTLVTNGFNIYKVDRFSHENNLLHTYKYDKLGAQVRYSILFTDDSTETSIIETLVSESQNYFSTPIIVGDNINSLKCKVYTNSDFFNFFGGIVNTGIILINNLPSILDELGRNTLPNGLFGKPNDLHELYVKECLQFITESPTRRYGINRSFESVPDIVVLGKGNYMLLVDSKAYSNGFNFSADDLRRFKSYVDDFRFRYAPLFGNILSFIVVSSQFNDSPQAIEGRSRELYSTCNCTLCCIESKELGNIAQLMLKNPNYRSSILWKNIFTNVIVNKSTVTKEITRLKKDTLI